jgi:hypothetical protein
MVLGKLDDLSTCRPLVLAGCYIGQETIARLITYNGVKQHLWGIELSESVEPGSVITLDGAKVTATCLFDEYNRVF